MLPQHIAPSATAVPGVLWSASPEAVLARGCVGLGSAPGAPSRARAWVVGKAHPRHARRWGRQRHAGVAAAAAAVAAAAAAPPRRRSEATRERLEWLKRVEAERVRNVVAVRCRHLLLASEQLADEVRQRLRSSPGSFPETAQQLSLCTATASAGGDVGWIGQSDAFLEDLVPEEVRRVALVGQPGDILKVKSVRGWHLLLVEDVMLDLQVKVVERSDGDDDSPLQGTYTVETMGCQMNVADSERMEGQLLSLGLKRATEDDVEDPRVVVLNTCSIRDKAEQKVYARLDPHIKRKRRGDDVTIVVSGCVAQQEGEALLRQVPEVDAVVGPQYANRLADVLHESRAGGQVCATAEARIMEDLTMPNRQSQISAWVNVIYGCNERCTYCVVPATRGSEQSRPMESVRREVQQLAAEGYREVTLLGQNIDAYGRDLAPRRTFADLLRYVGDVEGVERIRFLTSHPRYISDDLIRAVRDTPSVCEQFHIPFQSGSDGVLQRMERGYTSARYLQIVERIRAEVPEAALSADAIVGFPGETEEQFEQTLELMRAVRFDTLNTAAYSPRPGTPAATWEEQVAEEVKRERLRRINELAYAHALERNEALIGREVEVLVEGPNPRRAGQLRSRSRGGRRVFFEGAADLLGALVPVRVTQAYNFSVVGEMVGEPR